MRDDSFFLLPEGLLISDFVDDPEFTEVTFNGEVYTLYRIVRITHEATDHPQGWTHMANVVRVRAPALGVALLRIVGRSIEDARVSLSGIVP
ncbi:MAG: hypothetical protein RIQ64_968 [Actinomycetota bacterium]|jgi:hypothetical protein